MANLRTFNEPIRVGRKTTDQDALTGVIYYNSSTNTFKFRDNSSYKTIADRSFLSSTANGQGASQVGIEDAATYFTSTNVEGALAELYVLASAGGSSEFSDALFRVQDDGDDTKQLAVELAGATTGTTMTLTSSQTANRALTLPNTTDTLVAAAFAQTLTNKTIVAASNTITTAASGNLTSTELNAALAELQGDIDTRALDSVVIKKDGSVTYTANQPMGTHKLTGLSAGTTAGDSVRYEQAILISGVNAFAADQSMGGFKLTNLADPTTGTDAVNLNYLSARLAGLKPKQSVRAATTVAGTLATSFEDADVIDGVTLATGDRILIKNQASAAENGIYTVNASGSPTRATDFDSLSPIDEINGAWVAVQEGTAQAGQVWVQYGTVAVLDTDAINFEYFNPIASLIGGDMIAFSSSTFSVDLATNAGLVSTNPGNAAGQLQVNDDNSTLERNSNTLRVKDAGITNAKIATGIDAAKLADGSVSNTEFQYINSLTSNAQTQIDSKVTGPASATDNAIARFDSTTGKLIQNSTSSLGDTGALSIADIFKRGDSGLTRYVEQEYMDVIAITASTTDVADELTFDSRVYKDVCVDYVIYDGTNRRKGKLDIVCDGDPASDAVNVSIPDDYAETGVVDIEWSAAVNGDNIEISYTTGTGTFTMSADVSRKLA